MHDFGPSTLTMKAATFSKEKHVEGHQSDIMIILTGKSTTYGRWLMVAR